MLRTSHAFTLDKVIRYNFVPAIRYSFVPARKEEQFCTCTAPKLFRYSVNAREKEHFCIESKVIRYSVNAALVNYVGEGPRRPKKSPNKGRKKGEIEENGISPCLLILDLKNGKLWDSGKQEEGKRLHKLHVPEVNDDFWEKFVRVVGSETWKGCE